ncbi:hypothetical protein F2Q69_00046430 [Brassica cretica]|uniref:Ubiquitin-like protease family profile domain-containing protein n=1 Tax=Brassica cretica TaxID=69181 RepID=A0A8S9PMX8_BRACR|nr:hypothetical protein F2Q69_00046430 [Brassica cretica]
MKLRLGRDVDTVYTPMNWGGDHRVGLCIKLIEGHVTVFDSYVPHTEIEYAMDCYEEFVGDAKVNNE